jgi:hypothetical protein
MTTDDTLDATEASDSKAAETATLLIMAQTEKVAKAAKTEIFFISFPCFTIPRCLPGALKVGFPAPNRSGRFAKQGQ